MQFSSTGIFLHQTTNTWQIKLCLIVLQQQHELGGVEARQSAFVIKKIKKEHNFYTNRITASWRGNWMDAASCGR